MTRQEIKVPRVGAPTRNVYGPFEKIDYGSGDGWVFKGRLLDPMSDP